MPATLYTCAQCGTEFSSVKRRYSKQQFCSRECQRLGQTYVVGQAYSKSGPYAGKHVCPECQVMFEAHHSSVVYCSDRCRNGRRLRLAAERYSDSVVGHQLVGWRKAEMKQSLLSQSPLCGICGEDLTVKPIRDVHLDHDHVTGRIRGLLCFSCNTGLGNFKDDTTRLKKAIAYLEQFGLAPDL